MGRSLNPSSSEQPSHQDDHDFSHYQGPHTTHFSQDLRSPKVEVNKFDASCPTGWVTQMEHYFSLHGITDDLTNLRYGILYLYLERWQWWKWKKMPSKGMLLEHSLWQSFITALTMTHTI
jgi:hypothetical protein